MVGFRPSRIRELPDIHLTRITLKVLRMTESASRPVILLVDDNPHDVVLIRLAFRKVGIIDTIQLVKDGNEAMRYIRGEGAYADRHHYPMPTLILLDLKMPQANGFDVLEMIRQSPALNKVTIVVMSGSRDDSDISRAYDLGANAYLVKPTRFEDLVKMMETIKDLGPWKKNRPTPGKTLETSWSMRTTPVPA
jgi:CheY-like chemotaxis protein